jgi:hypothetical protein
MTAAARAAPGCSTFSIAAFTYPTLNAKLINYLTTAPIRPLLSQDRCSSAAVADPAARWTLVSP